jgi:peroxiredoxin Q/BCP
LNTKTVTKNKGKKPSPPRKRVIRNKRGVHMGIIVAALVGVAIVVLGVIFFLNTRGSSSPANSLADQYAFEVGHPGVGELAPAILLPSTDGGTFDLGAQRGKTVLLYFQEGLSCEPCWNQLKDIQSQQGAFGTLGIDRIVSITSDPLSALKQKVADEGITLSVLSDPTLSVSSTYAANQYGMMGTSRDGHTFILVGPDGRIKWRADYGGAPKYIMYVPVENLLADIRAGLQSK